MGRINLLNISIILFFGAAFCLLQTDSAYSYTPVVCIDAGHGGYDSGAVGPTGFKEKEANMDISWRVRDLLQAAGYQVVMTRNDDTYISLQGRCDVANRAGASIFIAIHNNASAGGTGHGTETYYWKNGSDYSPEGQILASIVHEELMKQVQTSDRGVKGANFYVLRNSHMPSALVEGAFISNPTEEKLLRDAGFRQKIAQGVFNGIDRYFGGVTSTTFTVGPNSRSSMNISRLVFGKSVATNVSSDQPVLAERSMYFTYNGKDGGSNSIGLSSASKTWYLAEGYTGGDFDEWMLVENPNSSDAHLNVTYYVQGGGPIWVSYTVPASSRYSIHVDEAPYLGNAQVSAKIESDQPVIAERSMYFNYDGKDGGHNSSGAASTSTTWYLAEGYTGGDFDEYVLIQNPNAGAASVKATFMKKEGSSIERTYEVSANSRYTIHVDDVLPNDEVSTKLESTNGVGIVAERSMYFNYNGKTDGSNSIGVTSPNPVWYLAEGYTGGEFDEYILIQNPDPANAAEVVVTFYVKGGAPIWGLYTVPANSRRTIHVDEFPYLGSAEVSAKVDAINGVGIIAERSMYFNYLGKDGGHSSVGATSLSDTWYFAEGYTSASFDEWILVQNPNSGAATVTLDFIK